MIQICASLNHRKNMKAEPSWLIPLKPIENVELFIVMNPTLRNISHFDMLRKEVSLVLELFAGRIYMPVLRAPALNLSIPEHALYSLLLQNRRNLQNLVEFCRDHYFIFR